MNAPPATVKVAIAGLGVASKQLVPEIPLIPGIELVAAADLRPPAREAFQAQIGGRVYESVEELCADLEVDVVWVCTPNQFHCEHVLAAARHGKHVVVEKPMALSIQEAERMVEAAEGEGVKLLCGHTASFSPAFRAMRRIIDSGELGKLCAINVWTYTNWMLRPRMPQEVELAQGGGVVYRQGPHQVDTVRLLSGGLIRSVRAMTGQWMPERNLAPGYYAAYLECEDGVPITIVHNGYGYFLSFELIPWVDSGRRNPMEERRSVRQGLRDQSFDEVSAKDARRFGSRSMNGTGDEKAEARPSSGQMRNDTGIVIVSCERGDIRQSPSGLYIYDDDGVREVPIEGDSSSRRSELEEMRDAVALDRPVYHDGRWGMATLEVCLAIMQSARERREIMLSHQSPTRAFMYA